MKTLTLTIILFLFASVGWGQKDTVFKHYYQQTDESFTVSSDSANKGYLHLSDSLLSGRAYSDTIRYDKWFWRTVIFSKSTDTLRIIIDADTLYTDENYFKVLIQHEIKKLTLREQIKEKK